MLTETETTKLLKETGALLEGHFILSSGLRSEKYVQCAKLLMFPDKAEIVCKSLADKIKVSKLEFDAIVSPAIGGILAGYEVSRHLNVPSIFVERVNGIFALRRGFSLNQIKKILIVEDVITTGKSSLECAKLIESLGSIVSGFACIIDRSSGKSLIKSKIISQISFDIPTYAPENLPEKLRNIKAIKPGSREVF
jgi:orotate phosphoribosyltransferase